MPDVKTSTESVQTQLTGLKVRYTNKSAQVGELALQKAKLEMAMGQMMGEMHQLQQQFDTLAKTLDEKSDDSAVATPS